MITNVETPETRLTKRGGVVTKIGRIDTKSKIENGRTRNDLKNSLSGMMIGERRTLGMGNVRINIDMVGRKNSTRGEEGARVILGDRNGKGIMKSSAVD